uniref:Uncharacterized protein n=1 Tax=Physcomitrium patens TaxID=3218 RepID=A0A2K1IB86_PHYPA|nr:hypothetical protein PHYPA_031104 [Physcomitrium patens]
MPVLRTLYNNIYCNKDNHWRIATSTTASSRLFRSAGDLAACATIRNATTLSTVGQPTATFTGIEVVLTVSVSVFYFSPPLVFLNTQLCIIMKLETWRLYFNSR